jgi:hypothetical protein
MEIVVGIVAFAIVGGWAGLAWLRHGRDPHYGDDPSILTAAPPPEMTAATATIVSGGDSHVAFVAALLDLASRDEIAFRQGSGPDADAVGIEIHGGGSTNPQVALDRRRPVGEGEAWLLGQLHLEAALGHGGAGASLATIGVAGMLSSVAAFATGTRDQAGANAAGMFAGSHVDPDALAAAYASRHGKPMPDHVLQELRLVSLAPTLLSDPALARDPVAMEAKLSALGIQLTPEQAQKMREWAAHQVEAGGATPPAALPAADAAATASAGAPAAAALAGATATAGSGELYIAPSLARALPAPLGFGTLLENYARRHGWIGGLSFIERWKWRGLGAIEFLVGLTVATVGRATTTTLMAVGVGIFLGGLATWLIAPAMPSRTAGGAMMVAQLAAYRRTLKFTFGDAASMNDAMGKSGLSWLETPDEVLVWGVALGLRDDIETLLKRGTDPPVGGAPAGGAYLPGWYREPDSTPVTTIDPARMFAAIEAIGSQPGGAAMFAALTADHVATP